MTRVLFPSCLLLAFFGCINSPVTPEPPRQFSKGEQLIVKVSDVVTLTTPGNPAYRLGGYFDFSPYDSLSIAFTAERSEPGGEVFPFSVKIGPGYYCRGELTGQKQDFALVVHVPALAKPGFAAVSFFIPDSVPSLILSDFRVSGWYSY